MIYYDNLDNMIFECYVVNFNHEQTLLHIAKLKLILNYWGFTISNIFFISELLLRKYCQSISLQLFSLIRRVQFDIYGTSIDQFISETFVG